MVHKTPHRQLDRATPQNTGENSGSGITTLASVVSIVMDWNILDNLVYYSRKVWRYKNMNQKP